MSLCPRRALRRPNPRSANPWGIEALPGYAGLYFDQPAGGVLDIALTSSAASLPDVTALLPLGTIVRFRQVSYTWADLVRVQHNVESAMTSRLALDDAAIRQVWSDPISNRVKVGVDQMGAEDRAGRKARRLSPGSTSLPLPLAPGRSSPPSVLSDHWEERVDVLRATGRCDPVVSRGAYPPQTYPDRLEPVVRDFVTGEWPPDWMPHFFTSSSGTRPVSSPLAESRIQTPHNMRDIDDHLWRSCRAIARARGPIARSPATDAITPTQRAHQTALAGDDA